MKYLINHLASITILIALIACAKPADEAAKAINGLATQVAFNPDGTKKQVTNAITNIPCKSEQISVNGVNFDLKAQLNGDGNDADTEIHLELYYGDGSGSGKNDEYNKLICTIQANYTQRGLNLAGGGKLKEQGLDYTCVYKKMNISHDDLKAALKKFACK